MASNNSYYVTEEEFKIDNETNVLKDKVYSYTEAIDIAGTGWYTRSLLLTLCLCLLNMAVDMFGFSIIVTGCACELDLNITQKSILISVPFIGPIVMSYFWGYYSDTQGRRRSMLISMWGGFIVSTISAFSTHWYLLGILKIISTSFSSSANSIAYTYLGETCPERVKETYFTILTAALMLFILAYDVPGYVILNLDFRFDWGLIFFTPWRLLTIVLAAPLGISAVTLHFFSESPKFLLNAGHERQALDNLRIIWNKNGNVTPYPVTKVILIGETTIKRTDESILTSFINQLLPLFKPPLLWRTMQLFYLTVVVYGVNSGLVMWMPIIVENFTAGLASNGDGMPGSLCDIIQSRHIKKSDYMVCKSSIDTRTLLSGVAHGIILSTTLLCISKIAYRKKFLITVFFTIPLLCTLAVIYNENNVASMVLYVGILLTNLCTGFLFTYFVDLFPTSYRGMVACLSVMVSRMSGLAFVHFIGVLVESHCTATFYSFAGLLLSGIIVAYFLPADVQRKSVDDCPTISTA